MKTWGESEVLPGSPTGKLSPGSCQLVSLEDQAPGRTDTWLITMVSCKSPKDRVVLYPFQMAMNMANKSGWSDHHVSKSWDDPPRVFWKMVKSYPKNNLEPQTTIYKWLFQLDDSQSLHRKWLFHQTSIYKWLFGVPGRDVQKLGLPRSLIPFHQFETLKTPFASVWNMVPMMF